MASSGDEDDRNDRVTHTVVVPEMLQTGLKLLYSLPRIQRVKNQSTNIKRFVDMYGIDASTACSVYEDMQKTDVVDAKIDNAGALTLKYFLISLYYIRHYPKLTDVEAKFDYSPGWISSKIWEMLKHIQALKEEKVLFPDDVDDDIWIMTVDGIHCWSNERPHPEFSQDTKIFSHKFNHAGYSYELGISLTGGLIWMHGPFDAGANDIVNFRRPNGLKDKLLAMGKMAIGDRGYRGEPSVVSFFNALDSKSVKVFKSRSLMRHECFNGMIKVFDIVSGRFRHPSREKFAVAFESICVLCQYKVENEVALFDILIQRVIDADDDSSESDSDSNSSESSISSGLPEEV